MRVQFATLVWIASGLPDRPIVLVLVVVLGLLVVHISTTKDDDEHD
jgi:hypothetical protein